MQTKNLRAFAAQCAPSVRAVARRTASRRPQSRLMLARTPYAIDAIAPHPISRSLLGRVRRRRRHGDRHRHEARLAVRFLWAGTPCSVAARSPEPADGIAVRELGVRGHVPHLPGRSLPDHFSGLHRGADSVHAARARHHARAEKTANRKISVPEPPLRSGASLHFSVVREAHARGINFGVGGGK